LITLSFAFPITLMPLSPLRLFHSLATRHCRFLSFISCAMPLAAAFCATRAPVFADASLIRFRFGHYFHAV
jgi:hypothetical protein